MTNVHVVNPYCSALQAHDLLMMLHQAKYHGDGSRQRGRRQQSKDRRTARALKHHPVPLYFVDPTVYIREVRTPTGRFQKKEVHAVYFALPSGEWRRHELSA